MVNPFDKPPVPTKTIERPPTPEKLIPESEMQIVFVRSSGPGGQKTNKTSSQAQLHWNVGASKIFSDEEKAIIRVKLGNRINVRDELNLASDQFRSQGQNKDFVIENLRRMVSAALKPEIKRRATRPTWGSQERRLAGKEKDAQKKAGRRERFDE